MPEQKPAPPMTAERMRDLADSLPGGLNHLGEELRAHADWLAGREKAARSPVVNALSDHRIDCDCPTCGLLPLAMAEIPAMKLREEPYPVDDRIADARKIGQKIPVRLRIDYEDGSTDSAEGTDAFAIWNWLMGCQGMNLVHGAVYSGPQLVSKAAPSRSGTNTIKTIAEERDAALASVKVLESKRREALDWAYGIGDPAERIHKVREALAHQPEQATSLVLRCHGCTGTVIYKRHPEIGEIEIFHSCACSHPTRRQAADTKEQA